MYSKKFFNIPIVLFIFKRDNTVLKIIEKLKTIKPKKVYLISDNGRNDEEKNIVKKVRKTIENAINWECEIIKNYAEENKGVYKNIGCGATWVFSQEEQAIFLEDDNLPEISFFNYCKELLEKYKNNEKILWICGTNYLEEYDSKYKSYYFTQQMLPCGWASWSEKFLKYYDGELKGMNKETLKEIKKTYIDKRLYFQEENALLKTKYLLENKISLASWDRQMMFSIKKNNLYGIIPARNQIRNIGVDSLSTHGGNSFQKIMTKRFCGMDSLELEFPLKHPFEIKIDIELEEKLTNIILYPLKDRIKILLASIIKPILRIDKYESFSNIIKK